MAISPHVKSELFENSDRLIRIDRHLPAAERRMSPCGPAWTEEEHDRFLQALELYPSGPWKRVAAYVGSKTPRQTMTHAQRYREKIARRKRGLKINIGDQKGVPVGGPQMNKARTATTTTDDVEIEFCFGQHRMQESNITAEEQAAVDQFLNECETFDFDLDLLANYEPLILEDEASLLELVNGIEC